MFDSDKMDGRNTSPSARTVARLDSESPQLRVSLIHRCRVLELRLAMAAVAGVTAAGAHAQAVTPITLAPGRAQVEATPLVADLNVERQVKVSGTWPHACIPLGASVEAGGAGVVFGSLVVRLTVPRTLACALVLTPYSFTVKYTPRLRAALRVLVLADDGEYLGEGLLDTRAAGDRRSAFNITGMWYEQQSNGSGLTFVHSRLTDNAVFGTWYVYDASGRPRWYTIQNTGWTSEGRVLEGTLYESSAVANCPAPFTACPVPIGLLVTVGRARLTLTGDNSARVEALTANGTVIFSSNVIRAEI